MLNHDLNLIIGSWRLSHIEDIAYPKHKLSKDMNLKLKIPQSEIHKLDIKDAYDRAAMCHILE